MRVSSVDDVSALIALRCAPDRVPGVRAHVAESGIVLRGHFQLRSGSHTEYFLRARGVSAREDLLEAFARELLRLIPGHGAQVVLGPESAGFAIAATVARIADLPLAVLEADIHRRPSSELRAGQLVSGARALVVNDVATSGSSLRWLYRAAAAHGAIVDHALMLAAIGPGALRTSNELGIAGAWLIETQWPVYAPASCDLCVRGVPLVHAAELG